MVDKGNIDYKISEGRVLLTLEDVFAYQYGCFQEGEEFSEDFLVKMVDLSIPIFLNNQV